MSSDDLSAVPVFPLPSVQLFPHALLPLHVFEPRYRDLVRDCMTGAQLMAVALLEPGYEASYHGRPAIRALCGLGRVVGHEPLPDGRSNILLRGLSRVRIVDELSPETAYRRVTLTRLADVCPPGFDGDGALRTLRLLADQLAMRLPTGGSTLRDLARSQAEPGALTDVLAAALVTDPDDRQALLETLDVAERVERVTAHLAAVLTRFTAPPSGGAAN
jgi:Lon protease-like protein